MIVPRVTESRPEPEPRAPGLLLIASRSSALVALSTCPHGVVAASWHAYSEHAGSSVVDGQRHRARRSTACVHVVAVVHG